MNDQEAVGAASASLLGELGTTLRKAVAQVRAEDATARRAADERTTSRLSQIDLRLEEISMLLSPPSSTERPLHRVDGLYLGPISAVMVIAFFVILGLAGAIGAKLVGDRAYASGQATGYLQAAAFERDHPAQWRAYQRSLRSR